MNDDTKGTSKDGAEPTGGEQSSAESSGADVAAQRAAGGTHPTAGQPEDAGQPEQAAEVDTAPEGGTRLAPTRARRGMFGVSGSGDTSGFGGLRRQVALPGGSAKPYGSWYDAATEKLESLVGDGAIEKVVVAYGELTLHIERDRLVEVAQHIRDDEALRFEFCSGVSGVHYPNDTNRELHAVYHLLSITHNRRIRLEVSCPDSDPHIPSIVSVYPANDWHERETWDFFGIIFDGHPALTRIQMPDDWPGHPQRKDYPLGGIDVEYKGATIPPPDTRRSYN